MKRWLACVLLLAACGDDDAALAPDAAGPPLPEVTDPLEYVDPTIGTGGFGFGHGSAFVGAAAPHGLCKLGPDTKGPNGTINFLHYSGYWAGDDTIQGFSHLHLHGTGATDYGVLSVMPTTAFAAASTSVIDYEQHFDKASEHAQAGRYAVTLDDGTHVELSAAPHSGFHVITFPAGAPSATVVFDLAKTLDGGTVTDADIALDPAARRASGRLRHVGGMSGGFGGYDVFFEVRTDAAWSDHVVWSGGLPAAAGESASGTGVGFALSFDPAGGPVTYAVGLSLVSAAGAAANLDAEQGTADAVLATTEAAWRAKTGAILVTGGSVRERRIFYTALYHAFMMPSWVGDVDGSYRIDDLAPLTAADHHQLNDFSLWDTYRSLHPLYDLIAGDSARDSVLSLAAFAQATGYFPRWPLATGEAGTMLGASAEIVVADAVVKDALGTFDAEPSYAILRAAALDPVAPAGGRGGRSDMEPYFQYGYITADVGRSVSMSTEYAHDDFALAQLAGALGHDADATALAARAHGYRALFDPASGFLRGHYTDGTLAGEPFNPLDQTDDFAEANAWQSLWMTGIHDPDGLAELFGGRAALIAKLEEFFAGARADWEETLGDFAAAALPRPYYWHGNEPDQNAVYLFAQAGRPDLTQLWVRWIMDNLYTDGPDGSAGNDDGGTLAAWYVWSALGLYPIAGSDRFVIGAPRFPHARVALAGGGELVIEAEGVSAANMYVQSVALDGVPISGRELRQSDLAGGATLTFVMGPAASDWGK